MCDSDSFGEPTIVPRHNERKTVPIWVHSHTSIVVTGTRNGHNTSQWLTNQTKLDLGHTRPVPQTDLRSDVNKSGIRPMDPESYHIPSVYKYTSPFPCPLLYKHTNSHTPS